MSLAQLKSFVTIARERNLTRAAESLNLSQSAISTQLKGLEDNLGVSLFERSTRGMILSEEGQVLLPQAKEVLDAYAALQSRAEALSRGVTASITIGLNSDPTFLRVSTINHRLSLLHPDLNVIFHSSESASTAQNLKNGTIDLGFFYGSLNDIEITTRLITRVRICVVIPRQLIDKNVPQDWDALIQLPWIWVGDKFPFFQALAEKFPSVIKPPSKIVTAANEQIVRELVAAGQGVALMREDELRTMNNKGIVIPWDQGWTEVPLCLGWLRDHDSLRQITKAREAICHIWAPETTDPSSNLSDKAWV